MPLEKNRKWRENKKSVEKDKVEANREEGKGEVDREKDNAEEKLKDEEDEEGKGTKKGTDVANIGRGSSKYDNVLRDNLVAEDNGDIPDELDNNPFYHGLVSSDDLCFILFEVGDFVIRRTQLSQEQKSAVVISVETVKKPQQIKHIRIHRERRKDDKSDWFACEKFKYGSVKELIDDYIKEKRPIHPDILQSVLIHGVHLMSWEFHHKDVKVDKLLGEGQFASVFLGEITAGPKKQRVAIKKVRLTPKQESKSTGTKVYQELMHEARLMRLFDHPNVIKCYGIAVIKRPQLIILELVDGGSLYGYLQQNRNKILRKEKIINMCYGTAKGLQYLHENNCIHRDIASRNILYTNDKIAKISDFGLSRIGNKYKMEKGKKIPIKWTAPETVAALIYTQKSDVFSYSIFMWEVFTEGDEPYKGLTHMEVRQRVGCGARLNRPARCPKNMFFLMQKCWEQNPDDRYDMKQVVQFFEDYLECKARRKKQVGITETTELTTKDDEDDVEEYLKRDGKNENKTTTEIDSNRTKIIKELQDKIARLRAINHDSMSSSSTEESRPIPKDRIGEGTDEFKERPEHQTESKPRRVVRRIRTSSRKHESQGPYQESRKFSLGWGRGKKSKEKLKRLSRREKLDFRPKENWAELTNFRLQALAEDIRRLKKQLASQRKSTY